MSRLRPLARVTPLVAGAVFVTGCALQPNDNTLPAQVAVGDDGYTVTVHFDQVENLVPNSTVQKDNVVIGTVASIEARDWEAVVKLRLLRSEPLPADTVFSIGQKTLLGAQYVEAETPARAKGAEGAGTVAVAPARMLEDGDRLGVDRTGSYPSTEQVLGAVALLLNDGGLSQISTITGELSAALDQRVPDARALVRRSNDLLAVLDANRGQIVTALSSLDRLSAGLRRDQAELATAIERIAPGLRVLEEERSRLVSAVTRTGRTSDQALRLVRASETALLSNLDALGPILTNLGQASRSLPEALKIGLTIPFPAMTTRNAVKGDFANLFATLDLRGSTLAGSWLGALPPALQSAHPIEAPLAAPAKPGDPTKLPLLTGLDPIVGDLLTGGGNGEPDPTTTPPCLLHGLGLC